MGDEPRPADETELALARTMGCTCHPDVLYRTLPGAPPGWGWLTFLHDDWCRYYQSSRAPLN